MSTIKDEEALYQNLKNLSITFSFVPAAYRQSKRSPIDLPDKSRQAEWRDILVIASVYVSSFSYQKDQGDC